MDIIKERLSREFGMETIFTTPTVMYLVQTKSFTDQRIKDGSNIMELIKSGLYIHIVANFDKKKYAEIEDFARTHTDDEIADRYQETLKSRILVRSGSDMVNRGDKEKIHEPMAEVEIV